MIGTSDRPATVRLILPLAALLGPKSKVGLSRLAALILMGTVAISSAAAESGATGRIEGKIVVGPELTARRLRFQLYPEPGQTKSKRQTPTSVTDELANVVVYIESVPPGAVAARPDPAPIRLEQEDLFFKPHVLAVVKGTTVEFPNRDNVFHNVFSLSKAASFDLGRYPSGSSKSILFDQPGIVKVFCHIHSDMTAIVMVLDNPFFTTPGTDGHFVIPGIPPGEYRVVAWHERAKRSTKKVRVEAGAASFLNFLIPLGENPDGG